MFESSVAKGDRNFEKIRPQTCKSKGSKGHLHFGLQCVQRLEAGEHNTCRPPSFLVLISVSVEDGGEITSIASCCIADCTQYRAAWTAIIMMFSSDHIRRANYVLVRSARFLACTSYAFDPCGQPW